MPIDPTEPDSLEEFPHEEENLDNEASEADAAEQRAELLEHRDVPLTGPVPAEANAADLAEQARVVELDDEDYR
ncbi:hypothetical protein PJ985_04695 [Streptomyces sp. ACA25]|uniref:hypothetical protein n=1 Tax=Streptomyces sp. ACA25 TaxID=3022596 RepID=UPI0023081F59|nr:hypothetical protein [Streptomyces sp. ACA25]MDB1086861.1 hypothetical protein [Streptomyces sp. ACA25]